MKDHPIIFSGPMVRALLEGRKTQTRRLATSPLRRVEAGDRLWVREAWRMPAPFDEASPAEAKEMVQRWLRPNVFFEADGTVRSAGSNTGEKGKLRPSIHMPRWASRLWLEVTCVAVERLQAISEQDALAEGVGPPFFGDGDPPFEEQATMVSSRMQYRNLWRSLHGQDSWDANPEVVAIEFTVHRGNIDEEMQRA